MRKEKVDKIIKSKHFNIFYNSDEIIRKANRRIYLPFGRYSGRGKTIEQQFCDKTELLLARVKKILGLYPNRMKNIRIFIYDSQKDLDKEVLKLADNGVKDIKKGLPSFYIHAYTTIYIIGGKINVRIFAHEMAHCVTRHWFIMPFSRETREILPQYVEKRIRERKRRYFL